MTRRTLASLTILLSLALAACSRGSGNGSTPSGSAVAGDAATATRGVELTEIARLRGSASANAPVGTQSALGSATSPLIATPASGSPPSGTVAAPAATRPAVTPASPPPPVSPVAPTGQPLQVVKVTADDGVNVREKPDANSAIVTKADYGAEFAFLELDVVGTDGTSHWVHVNLGDKTGYIRKDLVTGPQAPSPPTPTPDPRTPTAAPTTPASPAATPTGTPKP
jgi:uncharacterized protein YgiM (DUF1202 family)